MSEQQDTLDHARPGRPVSSVAWAALRGLAVGVLSVAAAAVSILAILEVTPVGDAPCDSDLACLPDLGRLILSIAAAPVVIAFAGPLIARLLRLPRPWLYSAPVLWAVVLACVGLGPGANRAHWPFDDTFSSLAILVVPYGVIALLVSRMQPSTRLHPAAPARLAAPPRDEEAGAV